METTFISIHDLSLDARLLYVSTSIVDILGYSPQDIIGKSCWEYFHPNEIPFARAIHGRGVRLDKAAVLNYCQIKNRDGRWVGCECVFTVVHDVLVASTSVYRCGSKSQKRAKDAPVIRRLFSSSPRDPRYHMLSYISHKFSQELRPQSHEPRAALFLNRFTRTLTIMYATNGLANVLGITADELNGKSFYYCIQENCLQEAVRCLESAKANDSIAYLRFWFRDPRQDDRIDHDESMGDGHSSGDDEDGGVHLEEHMDEGSHEVVRGNSYSNSQPRSSVDHGSSQAMDRNPMDPNSRSSTGDSTDLDAQGNDAIFDPPPASQSSRSSISVLTSEDGHQSMGRSYTPSQLRIELEAVVSCTSDGLVVILRRARAVLPQVAQSTAQPVEHPYANGFFASPWATDPILPDPVHRPQSEQPSWARPSLAPSHPTAAQAHYAVVNGPDSEGFMNTIREVAVFAWALTGINGSLAQYGRGKSRGESQPPGGLPIWEPDSNVGPERELSTGFGGHSGRTDTNGYHQKRDHAHVSNGNGGHRNGNGCSDGDGNHNVRDDYGNGGRNNYGNGNALGKPYDYGNALGKPYDYGNALGKPYDYGNALGKPYDNHPLLAGQGPHKGTGVGVGSGGTSWLYDTAQPVKQWDRVYSNEHTSEYEIRHYDETRRFGQ